MRGTDCRQLSLCRNICDQLTHSSAETDRGSIIRCIADASLRGTNGTTALKIGGNAPVDVRSIGDIPDGEQPWKGKMGKEITVTFTKPAVYGYKCLSHFALGTVGRRGECEGAADGREENEGIVQAGEIAIRRLWPQQCIATVAFAGAGSANESAARPFGRAKDALPL